MNPNDIGWRLIIESRIKRGRLQYRYILEPEVYESGYLKIPTGKWYRSQEKAEKKGYKRLDKHMTMLSERKISRKIIFTRHTYNHETFQE